MTEEVIRMSSSRPCRFLLLILGLVILSLARQAAGELVVLSTSPMNIHVYIVVPMRNFGPWYHVPRPVFVREVIVIYTGPRYVIPSDGRVILMDRWRSPIVTYRRWQRHRCVVRRMVPITDRFRWRARG